jgi:hypothetical protein
MVEKEGTLHGLHLKCFIKWFGVNDEFSNLMQRKAISLKNNFNKINSSFFHGKFRKYSANLGKTSYILKVKQKDYPELPCSEYLCNQIAKLLKIDIPEFYLIRFNGVLDTFVSKNFMQNIPNSTLMHMKWTPLSRQKF